MADTWAYARPIDALPPAELPESWVWERLRIQRNALLSATDHKMVADAPWDTAPWASYRQALRDLPASTADPRQAQWPRPPE